jgi:hypothetical protein
MFSNESRSERIGLTADISSLKPPPRPVFDEFRCGIAVSAVLVVIVKRRTIVIVLLLRRFALE